MADIPTPEKSQKRPFVGNVPKMVYKVRKVSAIKTYPRGPQKIVLKKSNNSDEIPNVGVLGCDSTSKSMLESQKKVDPPFADLDSTKRVKSLSESKIVPNVVIGNPAPDSTANTGISSLSSTREVDLNLVESAHSWKALASEITNLLKLDQTKESKMVDGNLKPFVGGCEQIATSTSNKLDVKAEPVESREVNLSENLNGSKLFDSMKESDEPASKDSLNVVSKTKEKEVSTSLGLQLPVESVEGEIYKYPRRSISAKRDFPVGCGRKALMGKEECQKLIQSSKDRSLGDEKSSGNDRLELLDRTKDRQGREEFQKFVYVRKKLKQMDTDLAPNSTLQTLVTFFSRQGLDETDLVALSGSHTIGVARCVTFGQSL